MYRKRFGDRCVGTPGNSWGHRVFRLRGAGLFQRPTIYCTDPAFLNTLMGPRGLDTSNESYDALKDATGLGYNNLITRKWNESYMDIESNWCPSSLWPTYPSAWAVALPNSTSSCRSLKRQHVRWNPSKSRNITEYCCKLSFGIFGFPGFCSLWLWFPMISKHSVAKAVLDCRSWERSPS